MATDLRAFITGSRSYGAPGPDSDVDLAVMVSSQEAETLWAMSDRGDGQPQGSRRVYFGKLNLIVFRHDVPGDLARYHAWRAAQADLELRAPVERREAIRTIRRYGGHGADLVDVPCSFDRLGADAQAERWDGPDFLSAPE